MITLIWAMSENGVIGRDGELPWHLPDDLAHFMHTTRGHPVIMGRKTFESVGTPLPDRTNIVVTRNPAWQFAGVLAACDVDAAIELASGSPGGDEVFVCGGSAVYRAAMSRAGRLVVTLVHAQVQGDTQFPDVDWAAWRLVSEELHAADSRHEFAYGIRVLERC